MAILLPDPGACMAETPNNQFQQLSEIIDFGLLDWRTALVHMTFTHTRHHQQYSRSSLNYRFAVFLMLPLRFGRLCRPFARYTYA